MKIIELTGSADTVGDLTLTSDKMENGRIEKIVYDWSDGDAIADMVITEEAAVSQPVLTVTDLGESDLTWYPRSLGNKVADASAFTDIAERIFITGNMKAVISGSPAIGIATIDGDATKITVDTSADHNLSVGNDVTVAGTSFYNGTYTVDSITDSNTFVINTTEHDDGAEAVGTIIRAGATYRLMVYVSDL